MILKIMKYFLTFALAVFYLTDSVLPGPMPYNGRGGAENYDSGDIPFYSEYLLDPTCGNGNQGGVISTDIFATRLIAKASSTGVGDYALPLKVWMSYQRQGHNNGVRKDQFAWVHYAVGMAGIIGAKLGLSAADIQKYFKAYGRSDSLRLQNKSLNNEFTAMAGAYGSGGDANKRYFDRYVTALFSEAITEAAIINARYAKRPTSGFSALASVPGLTKIDVGQSVDTVSIWDKDTIAFTNKPTSRSWSKLKAIQDADVFLWAGGTAKQINKSENYFHHGFAILTGLVPAWNNTHQAFFGGANPLNPFDPADSWGYVTDPLPEVQKKVKACANGNILVLGNDCQPYFYDNSVGKVRGYGLQYRDACADITANASTLYILKDNALYSADIASVTNSSKGMHIYDRGMAPVAPWDAKASNPESWGPSFYTRPLANLTPSDTWQDLQNNGEYDVSSFAAVAAAVAGTPNWEQIEHATGADWWATSGGKIFHTTDGKSFSEITGVTQVIKISVGTTKILALDNLGTLYVGDVTNVSTNAQNAWKNTKLKVLDCAVGNDDTIALIDGTDNSLYTLLLTDLSELLPPDFPSSSSTGAVPIKNGDSVKIKTGTGATATFIKISSTNGIASLDTAGGVFFVDKSSSANLFAFKGSNGKYLAASTSSQAGALGANLTGNLDVSAITLPSSDGSAKTSSPGQWILIPADSKHPTSFFIKERVSGSFIGILASSNNLGLVDDTTKIAFDVVAADSVDAATPGSTPPQTVGAEQDFDLFMTSVKSASDMEISNDDGSKTDLTALEAQLILYAAGCGIAADSTTLAPSTDFTLTSSVTKNAYGQNTAPSALATEQRVLAVSTELDTLTKDQASQDAISLNPGLANLLSQMLDKMTSAFPANKDIATVVKKIKGRFSQEKLSTGFPDQVKALGDKFLNITTQAQADDFVTLLTSTVQNRVDVQADSNQLTALITLINKALDSSLNASQKLQSFNETDSITALQKQLTQSAVTHQEVIDRIDRLASSSGVLSAEQKAVVKFLVEIMTSDAEASADGKKPAKKGLLRLKVAKERTQQLLDKLNKLKALNTDITIPDALNNLEFTDFAPTDTGGFLGNINNLFFKRGGNTDTTDGAGLWKSDSPLNNDAKTALALDPQAYYTLSEFWKDFLEWKNWNPDLSQPANKYPLIRICNQVIASINANFSSNSDYQTIKTTAQTMLTNDLK
jgi:hypothetical protein